jgi:hypothetical protein
LNYKKNFDVTYHSVGSILLQGLVDGEAITGLRLRDNVSETPIRESGVGNKLQGEFPPEVSIRKGQGLDDMVKLIEYSF